MADTTIERINIDIQVTSASAEQRIKRLEDALDAMKRASEDATAGASAAASGVGHSASHAAQRISTLEKGLHKVRNAVLSVPKNALSKAFSAAIAPVKSLERSVSSVSTRISSTFAALKRIAIYRLMRTMIKELTQGLNEGIQNLYKWSEYVGTRFHSSMDSMATSALYIKNSLATIAEPILNYLAPAIDFLADRFAALAATVAEFLAALTGQDQYTIALKFPKEYGEEAEETAKAMQKWLGPFDEINRLSDPRKSGKQQDLDWTKMFETMTVEGTGPIGQFVQKLKEGFQQGDLTEIGTILSTKLQEAMDGLEWPKIKAKARNIASSIGTFINGFFQGGGFTTKLGTTIAEALNTAIEFAATLKDTLDFAELGKSLGQGIQSFLNTFDFGKAIGTIVDWGVGFVTFLSNAISEVNWEDFGKKIGEGIRDVDWYKTFKAVFDLGSNILKGLFDVVIGITADGTLGDVFEGFGRAVGETLADKELWKKAFQAVTGLGTALVQGLFAAIGGFVSGITGLDINLQLDDETAKNIFTALFAGVTAVKFLSWILGGIGAAGGVGATVTATGAGLSLGFGQVALALGAVTIASAVIGNVITHSHWNPEKSPIALDWDDPSAYEQWKDSLTDYQKSLLSEIMQGMSQAEIDSGRDVYAEAFAAAQQGITFGDWYTAASGGGQYNPPSWWSEGHSPWDDPFGEHGDYTDPRHEWDDPFGEHGSYTDPFGEVCEGADRTTEKLAAVKESTDQMKKAFARSAKGIGKSSTDIDTHASATRKKFNLMEKGLDNIKKKTTAKDALGQSKFEKASKNIRESSKAATKRIGEIGTGVKSLKTRLVTKDALGQSKFESAAKNIRESSKATTKRVGEIGTKTDAIKKKMGKNPLGHTEFETSASNIKTAANGVGTSIEGIGTKADTTKTTLKGKMAEMVTDAGEFKTNAMGKFNEFSSGLTHGMELSMSDFVDEGNHGLDTMLRNYSKFSSETARLMADTSASYQGVQFYRYGGGGGPAPHPRPFTEYQMMANGGFLDNGEIFVAREAGPEMVGRFGNRNAVANNDQIVSGITAGVAEANEDVVNAIYSSISQVIGVIRENRSKNGAVNWDAVSRQISRVQKRQAASAYM